jgi:histidinol-phosphatase (PHP family)
MRDLVDYHVHTYLCGHAEAEPVDYVAAAARGGLAEMGFCDHFPLLHLRDPSLTMSLEELPRYVAEVGELKDRFSRPRIRLGVEVDYIPGTMERVSQILAGYDFDYVMGSVHFLDGWGFDDPRYLDGYREREAEEIWSRYFELLGDAAETGLFDVMAHPDLVKKFRCFPSGDLTAYYRECLDRFREAGVVVEVSTAGLRKPVEEIYPSLHFLVECRKRGLEVTLGSDAHRPEEVGWKFGRAVELLARAGYDRVVTFRERERGFLPLAP